MQIGCELTRRNSFTTVNENPCADTPGDQANLDPNEWHIIPVFDTALRIQKAVSAYL